MTTVLHIASSSNLAGVTRQIGHNVINVLRKKHEGAKIIERDLVKNPLPHLSPEFLGAAFSGNPQAPELSLSNELVAELFASDVIVIEAPMYNFGIPSVLKAWVDHVVRAKVTFQYGASGPEGLVKGKKAIIVASSGGIYSDGPAKALDHDEPYLRSVLGFIGITDVETIRIEGVALGAEKAEQALAAAKTRADALSLAA